MADRIQQRRDTKARWAEYNPILLEGELGYELDTDQYKLGDGEHAWNDLPYRGDPCLQQTGQSTTTPMSQKAVTDELELINANTGVDEYPTFSASTAYSAGDVVNYNGKLYKFTADHAAGAWTGTDVEDWCLKKSVDNLSTDTYIILNKTKKYIVLTGNYLVGDKIEIRCDNVIIGGDSSNFGAIGLYNFDTKVLNEHTILGAINGLHNGDTNKTLIYEFTENVTNIAISFNVNPNSVNYSSRILISNIASDITNKISMLESSIQGALSSACRYIYVQDHTNPTFSRNSSKPIYVIHWDVLFLFDTLKNHFKRTEDVTINLPNYYCVIYCENDNLGKLYFDVLNSDGEPDVEGYEDYKHITDVTNVVPICVVDATGIYDLILPQSNYRKEVMDYLIPTVNDLEQKSNIRTWHRLGVGTYNSENTKNIIGTDFKLGEVLFVKLKNIVIDPIINPTGTPYFYFALYNADTEEFITQYLISSSAEQTLRFTLDKNYNAVYFIISATTEIGELNGAKCDYYVDLIDTPKLSDINVLEISDYVNDSIINESEGTYAMVGNSAGYFEIKENDGLLPLSKNYLQTSYSQGNDNKALIDFRIYLDENFVDKVVPGQILYWSIEAQSLDGTQNATLTFGTGQSNISFTNDYSNFSTRMIVPYTWTKEKRPFIHITKPVKIGRIYIGNIDLGNVKIQSPTNDLGKFMEKGFVSTSPFKSIKSVRYSTFSNGDSPTTIVGYRTPISNTVDYGIDSMIISLINGAPNPIGTKVTIYVGKVDQRGWLLGWRTYEGVYTKFFGHYCYCIECTGVVVKKGESVFIDTVYQWMNNNFKAPVDPGKRASYLLTTDYRTTVEFTDRDIFTLQLFGREVSSDFATSYEVSSLEDSLSGISQQIASSNIYADVVTNKKYKIYISNGELSLKLLDYKKILVFGNSFMNHDISEGLWWDNIRGMASSVRGNDYVSFLGEGLGEESEIIKRQGNAFETSFSLDFDFDSFVEWPAEAPDAVVIQLGENCTYSDIMQQCWENFINYIKAKYVGVDIICVIGGVSDNRRTAIINAAGNCNIPALDCTSDSIIGAYRAGDYVTGQTSDDCHPMNARAITHPSDVGMLLIANKILNAFGQKELSNKLRNITLNQSIGGTLTTPYNQWVVNGLVTIRCEATAGYDISSLTVTYNNWTNSVIVTKRTNANYDGTSRTYYTFIMPDADVVVTPTWEQS